MEYAIIHFGVDDCRLSDIVKSINTGCTGTFWTESLFHRRFVYNPLGKAVLAGVFDAERVIACVAVERFPFQSAGRSMVGGILRVLFVQDGFMLQELWLDFLKLIEIECRRQGINIIVGSKNYDFSANVECFGWTFQKGKVRVRMNLVSGMWRSIFRLLELRKPFIADSNIETRKQVMDDNACLPDYYQWLIRTSTKRFVAVNNEVVTAVLVIGQRGKRVREAQICYFQPKKGLRAAQHSLIGFLNEVDEENKIDVISCDNDTNYLPKINYIKISQKVNYCYKQIDNVEFGEEYGCVPMLLCMDILL